MIKFIKSILTLIFVTLLIILVFVLLNMILFHWQTVSDEIRRFLDIMAANIINCY